MARARTIATTPPAAPATADPAVQPAVNAQVPGKPSPGKPMRGKPMRGKPSPGKPTRGKPAGAEPARARMPKQMSVADAQAFVGALAQANPDPKSDLAYSDPFTLLVAVVLSAQATDAGVNKATPALFAAAPTPAAMAALGADGIGKHIRTIGLWQGKAKNVAALAQALVEQHGGEVPNDRDALEALPGVGRKTANVVLNVAFGAPTMAVDTHVFRVANRTGLAPGNTPRAVEDALVKRLPTETLRLAHHWLILHGRYCCKARTPECWRCVAAQWCRYPDKTPPPGSKPPKKPLAKRTVAKPKRALKAGQRRSAAAR